jgi:alkylation response protein AidB-like acyl-CoA dehydrogenase
MRASDTSEVIFDDCRVPDSAMVGAPGEGFMQAMQVLEPAASASRRWPSGSRRARTKRAPLCARSPQFGRAIAEFQAIRWKLADMAHAHRSRPAAHLSRRLDARPARRTTSTESSIAKLYASEIAVRAAEEGVQIHGGYGFVKDYPAEKYFRDVKLCTIGEGTSEIQRLVIAASSWDDERGRLASV